MRAEQVLDMQGDLIDRLQTMPVFREYVMAVLGGNQNSGPRLTREEIDDAARRLTHNLLPATRLAYAFRVEHDMSALVQHAASTLDDSDLFSPDLAPTENGIVFFERPLPMVDVRGRKMLAHWLIWNRTTFESLYGRTPCTVAYWFNDHGLQPDEVAEFIAESFGDTHDQIRSSWLGRWGMIGCDVLDAGNPVGGPIVEVRDPEYRAKIIAEGDTPSPFTNAARYVHALWMLLGQSVTATETEHLRKTALKRNPKILNKRVTVIRMRRSEGSRREGESMVEWSHRWLVRGHPRWQPYGSRTVDHEHVLGPVEVENAHSVRRCQHSGCDHEVKRIWIPGHVKGPDGKPLRITDHVYDLVR